MIELEQLGAGHQIITEVDLMNKVDEVDQLIVVGVAGHVIGPG